MRSPAPLVIFGEVLFDKFPDGREVLGGAPFNVAWHLQALGDAPLFISRVGDDPSGAAILASMQDWGMLTDGVQRDPQRPTGSVTVSFVENEPHYSIDRDRAYDAIAPVVPLPPGAILYHGSLALRSPTSRVTLEALAASEAVSIFVDVNLRYPFWQRDEVVALLRRARWAKLNGDELAALGFAASDLPTAMAALQDTCNLELLILTRGADGALLRTVAGELITAAPPQVERVVDTVGAGDAFSALCLHGLNAGWPLPQLLERAQRFAAAVVGLRGATTTERAFYAPYL